MALRLGLVPWLCGRDWCHGFAAWTGAMALRPGLVRWLCGWDWCHGFAAGTGEMALRPGLVRWLCGRDWCHGFAAGTGELRDFGAGNFHVPSQEAADHPVNLGIYVVTECAFPTQGHSQCSAPQGLELFRRHSAVSPQGTLPTSLCSVTPRNFADVTLQCHPTMNFADVTLQYHPRNFADVILQCHQMNVAEVSRCLYGLAVDSVVLSVAGGVLPAPGDL